MIFISLTSLLVCFVVRLVQLLRTQLPNRDRETSISKDSVVTQYKVSTALEHV